MWISRQGFLETGLGMLIDSQGESAPRCAYVVKGMMVYRASRNAGALTHHFAKKTGLRKMLWTIQVHLLGSWPVRGLLWDILTTLLLFLRCCCCCHCYLNLLNAKLCNACIACSAVGLGQSNGKAMQGSISITVKITAEKGLSKHKGKQTEKEESVPCCYAI